MTGARRPLILAHRGDHRAAPENSLPAVAAAFAMPGCNGVEIDVRAASDGTPVVVHDPTLERLHGRPERIADLAPAELAALGIPRLQDVLDVLPASCILDLELNEEIIGPVLQLLGASARTHPTTIVSSFLPAVLAGIRQRAPSTRTWLNADRLDDRTIRTAGGATCDGVAVRWTALGRDHVEAATRSGLEVAAWTVTAPGPLADLAAIGVAAIIAEGDALAATADRGGQPG